VLNSSYYFSIDRRKNSIAAFKFKIGHIQTFYGDYSGIPLNRTFYVGGSNSVRGWHSNQLAPQGTDSVKNVQGISVKGGTFMVEGSLEYRYRFLQNFGTALFADYGNTWLGYKQFQFDKIAVAVGFGFRYYTEVVPFRIDFGFKFYDPSNKKYVWNNWNPHFMQNIEIHFGIGEAF
jgi:outer membrane protein insertion porin family